MCYPYHVPCNIWYGLVLSFENLAISLGAYGNGSQQTLLSEIVAALRRVPTTTEKGQGPKGREIMIVNIIVFFIAAFGADAVVLPFFFLGLV